jgi:hypothetical protein
MPTAERAKTDLAGIISPAVGRVGVTAWARTMLPFSMAAVVILFTYFDVYHHYWFLKLLNGYVIKAWIFPAILLLFVLWHTLRCGSLPDHFTGLKFPSFFLCAYILFGSVSLAWNEDLYHAVKYGLIMFGPVMIYLAALLFLDDNRLIEKVILLLFWAGVLLSGYVFYMYEIQGYSSWVGEPFAMRWMWTRQEVQEILTLNYHSANDYFDYSKTLKLIDEPAFAAMLSPLILFGFFRAVRSSTWPGWLFYIPSFFMLYTLLGTAARSSFVAFIAGLVFFLWFIRTKRLHVLLIVLATALLVYSQPFMMYRIGMLAGAVLTKVSESTDGQKLQPVTRRLEVSLKKLEASLGERMPIQQDGHIESVTETIERTRNYPILGYGIGRLLAEHATSESSWHIEHNRYLFILSTSGLLTVVPYVLFLIALSWLAWKTHSSGCNVQGRCIDIGLVLFPALILFAVQITNCGQERYYYWVFFGLAAAWIRNMTLMESREHSTH